MGYGCPYCYSYSSVILHYGRYNYATDLGRGQKTGICWTDKKTLGDLDFAGDLRLTSPMHTHTHTRRFTSGNQQVAG
uniref:Uncharacterized protein n=1 Tax=Trichobilharzia regenti TaxID=157069 RepID=A0AA85IW89_TRIRE|nr:unnamed protein product [Trichobilharzia regenti]